jgi:hypothetical protein
MLPDFTTANKPGIYIRDILENANAATEKDYTYPAMPNPFICSYKMDQLDYDREDVHVYVGEDDQRFVEQTAYFKRAEIQAISFWVNTDAQGHIVYGGGGGVWDLNQSVWYVGMGQNFQLHLVTDGQLTGSPSGHYLLSLVTPPGFLYTDNIQNTDPYLFGMAPVVVGPYNFGLVVQDADNQGNSHAFYGLQIVVTNAGGGSYETLSVSRAGSVFRDSNFTNFDSGFLTIGETWDSGVNFRSNTRLSISSAAAWYDFNMPPSHWMYVRDDRNGSTYVGNGAMYGQGTATWLATNANMWKPWWSVFEFKSWGSDTYEIVRKLTNAPAWSNSAFVAIDTKRTPSSELWYWNAYEPRITDLEGDGDPYYSGGFHQAQGIVVLSEPGYYSGYTSVELDLTFNENSLGGTMPENLYVLGVPATAYEWEKWGFKYLDGFDMSYQSMTNTPATNYTLFVIPKYSGFSGGSYHAVANPGTSPGMAKMLYWLNSHMTGERYYLVFLFCSGPWVWSTDMPGPYRGNGVVNRATLWSTDVVVKAYR